MATLRLGCGAHAARPLPLVALLLVDVALIAGPRRRPTGLIVVKSGRLVFASGHMPETALAAMMTPMIHFSIRGDRPRPHASRAAAAATAP